MTLSWVDMATQFIMLICDDLKVIVWQKNG